AAPRHRSRRGHGGVPGRRLVHARRGARRHRPRLRYPRGRAAWARRPARDRDDHRHRRPGPHARGRGTDVQPPRLPALPALPHVVVRSGVVLRRPHRLRRRDGLLPRRPGTPLVAFPQAMTAHPPPVDDWDPTHRDGGPDAHWTTTNAGEAFPGVVTPLSWTFVGDAAEATLRRPAHAVGALTARERDVPTGDRSRFIQAFYGRVA